MEFGNAPGFYWGLLHSQYNALAPQAQPAGAPAEFGFEPALPEAALPEAARPTPAPLKPFWSELKTFVQSTIAEGGGGGAVIVPVAPAETDEDYVDDPTPLPPDRNAVKSPDEIDTLEMTPQEIAESVRPAPGEAAGLSGGRESGADHAPAPQAAPPSPEPPKPPAKSAIESLLDSIKRPAPSGGPSPSRTPSATNAPRPQAPAPAQAAPTVGEACQANLRDLAAGPGSTLWRIKDERLTGHLLLICEGKEGNKQELLFFREGALIACNSLVNASVRHLLLSAGVISMEDIQEAERRSRAGTGKPAPEFELMRMGKVNKEQILEVVGNAVREAALEALAAPYGIYIWRPAATVAPPKTLCKIPAVELALHFGRRVMEVSDLCRQISNPSKVLKLSVDFESLRSLVRLTPLEWKFLFRVDGRRPLRQIRESLEISSADFDRLVYTARFVGMVEDSGQATPEEPALAAPPPQARAAAPALEAPSAPIHVPAPPPMRPAPQPAPQLAPQAPTQSASEPRARSKRVLVVDDSRTVQKMVHLALAPLGLELEYAGDGLEALQLAKETVPDLVLMDVVMPRLDGYKACSHLKKIVAPAKVPVIMLTAKDGTFNLIKAKLAGAAQVMGKPFDAEELREAVRKRLEEPQG